MRCAQLQPLCRRTIPIRLRLLRPRPPPLDTTAAPERVATAQDVVTAAVRPDNSASFVVPADAIAAVPPAEPAQPKPAEVAAVPAAETEQPHRRKPQL